jgi:hypothetical protein
MDQQISVNAPTHFGFIQGWKGGRSFSLSTMENGRSGLVVRVVRFVMSIYITNVSDEVVFPVYIW